MVDIADFVPHSSVPPETTAEYRGRVPDELVEIWEQYGYGTFAEGFLRVVDPKQFEAELADCIGKTQGDGIAIPIMVTGLGDLITWEPGLGLVAILYRAGRVAGLGTKLKTFLTLVKAGGAAHLSRTLEWDVFPQAVAVQGEPAYEESFIFVPLLSLGGQVRAENLHRRETIPAIRMMVETQGVIGH
ncbi:GAD-like domain-containing protein [Microbacterium sp. JZ31]|uniref:GAD-like domain-containing protein n=1 Tax=Microbacterium sp. JZ31 TaxID=1906274 RepID=UPI00193194B1|nr:GAD-like domain-containing protein [Microbacterium sp. JZ31]